MRELLKLPCNRAQALEIDRCVAERRLLQGSWCFPGSEFASICTPVHVVLEDRRAVRSGTVCDGLDSWIEKVKL